MADYDMAQRFARDTAHHQMTIAHDDGLYRHVQFRNPQRSWHYWFDLITVPGALIFQGDGESFVFRRVDDMFTFFRGGGYDGEPNLSYWAEKVTSDSRNIQRYSETKFVQTVREHLVESIRYRHVPPGTSRALIEYAADYDLTFEANAREMLETFSYKGFGFPDAWEFDFRTHYWWFEWACHAIVWGIGQYDGNPARPMPPAEETRPPEPIRPPRMVDVHLPAMANE
ncbi:hypothetical protein [Amycolatopsis suaedae]|uniref:Uncharacterized protein n=1 Tax=Amycolatopsis suaedae TaxID=2510978 RepID=A0A4Q7J1K2_9PSEU|nr:hypothetical protein [Amycolatopsis suaedae]RZQ59814.1 hypothetical protein EWH70_32380 [Amycolatopsis suaedae]